jgi:histidine ammonia-lyase
MGSIGSRKLARVVEHVKQVLAIESLVAAQGLDFRLPLEPGVGVLAAHRTVREQVPTLTEDRPLHLDITSMARLIDQGALVTAAATAAGPLR